MNIVERLQTLDGPNFNAYKGFQIAAKTAKALNIGRTVALGVAAAALVMSGIQLFRNSPGQP